MGLVNTEVSLSNPRRTDLEPDEITALADTGATHLCIPDHVRLQLDLETMDLVVNPRTRSLDVNPESPNLARSSAR
jgi:hypothetical protein